MSGFGKLHSSMWEGSLYGQLEASAVLMALVTICNAQGVVDMTPEAIAGRIGWPIDFIKKGLTALESPDARSRTPEQDGRRLIRIDDHREWGWIIVNYEKYREKKDADRERELTRERVRKFRSKHGADPVDDENVTPVTAVTAGNAKQKQKQRQEAEEDSPLANARGAPVAGATSGAPPLELSGEPPARIVLTKELREQIIAAYHEILPDFPGVKIWNNKRQALLADRVREGLKRKMPAHTVEYWERVFRRVAASDFLCGRTREPFRCPGLEWLLEERNFTKLIEGARDNVVRSARR